MRVLSVVTIALLLNIGLHRWNTNSPNYAEKCPTFTQKKLRRFTENLGDFSKNVGELFWILRLFWCAIPHISLPCFVFAPPLLLKSKSSLRAFAPQLWPKLGYYGELWGNSPFFEPFKGEVVLYCNVNCLIKVITIAPFIIFEGVSSKSILMSLVKKSPLLFFEKK